MTMLTRSKARELESQRTTFSDGYIPHIQKALTCPCCQHIFHEPTTLTCGHSLCLSCVSPLTFPVCPINNCNKSHYDRLPKLDVVLSKITRMFDFVSCSEACSLCLNRTNKVTSPQDTIETLQQELECQLCYVVFYEPITTSCGHTLCKQCILRSLDYSDKCSICRSKLPSYSHFSNHASNYTIQYITSKLFPHVLLQRQESIANDLANRVDETPLFVCSIIFPKMPCLLHVFEARYRVMIRRCMETSRQRFGMVLHTNQGVGFHEYGTMVEARSINMLLDGRYMVDAVGTYRFRIIERGIRDGYNIARVERIEDSEEEFVDVPSLYNSSESSSDSSPLADYHSSSHPSPSISQLQSECISFLEALKSSSAPWLYQRLNSTVGPMPSDPSDFSFWMASIIPLDEQEKYIILPVTSVRERLTIILKWINRLKDQWWFDKMCSVM